MVLQVAVAQLAHASIAPAPDGAVAMPEQPWEDCLTAARREPPLAVDEDAVMFACRRLRRRVGLAH